MGGPSARRLGGGHPLVGRRDGWPPRRRETLDRIPPTGRLTIADDFERVLREQDPVRRGRLATDLLGVYQQRTTELARIRKAALSALQRQGMSYADVAAAFGLSKGRIGQIRHSGPIVERRLFGIGPITVAFPLRQLIAREKPVIASEDALAVDRLSTLLRELGFETERYPIPVDGRWKPRGDVIAICGPRSSSVVAEAMARDPVLAFEADDADRWHLMARTTGETFYSASDLGGLAGNQEVAYIGRLPVETGTMFVIAGVHATGSVAAVEHLARHRDEIYAQVHDKPFSMAVAGTVHDQIVQDTEVLCPPRLHRDHES